MVRGSLAVLLPLSLVSGGALAEAVIPTQPAVSAPPGSALLSSATVIHVSTGQDLLVNVKGQERRVRLACIQAPRPQQQPFARQARQLLLDSLPAGTAVTLELRARDVFAREVAVVRHQGQDVAARQLQRGAVFVFDGYLGLCDDLPYASLEAEARRRKLGVWSTPGGIERPWDLIQRLGDTTAEP
ncbi:thermonuclease family protein [Synechococcus sp. CBW1006]|uniref:thermonuclease family protein n=1 Tax=Synechococcus sp. CBW1006 TaxID=1353138 RepID=UPI001E5294FA|nr:thermonuclease family protein [Synechococcus sp. CBW1006]